MEPRLVCDFVGGALGHRLRAGVGGREPLPRAVGFRPGRLRRVVDATAGVGRDAFLLASLGVAVTLIERADEVHAALAEGLARAVEAGPPYADIAARIALIHGDSRHHLARLRPEVVTVDPMHPPRVKTALVKQPMRRIRSLVGADEDSGDLLRAALAAATARVVLKWPARAALPPAWPRPHHSIAAGAVRYEVFLTGPPPGAGEAAAEP